MALACGCEFRGGMAVDTELLKAHLKHTMEAIFFWEMIMRPGRDPMATTKLSQARIDLIDAIEELYPEVKEEG